MADQLSLELLPESAKIEWSYSRRDVLEQCPRWYYYQYYGANAKTAKSFVAARHDKGKFHSALFTKSISAMADLLASTDEKDQRALVECLAELRILVEEHIHMDANRILGEI